MELAIEAMGLGKVYGGGVRALEEAEFCVSYGEVFAYLGRNGSGKTTTLRILTTLTSPTEGVARVVGHDILAEPQAVRREIGVTMQEAALDPEMTGREHLELIAGLWGLASRKIKDAAADLLEEFALDHAADRLIGTYSGGMRRRLDLAGALINKSRVLFLDEPTTGLDAQSRRALWDRVKALKEGGAAIFLTTQYLEEADVLADRVAILNEGRIVAQGTPDELRRTNGDATLRLKPRDSARAAALLSSNGARLDRQGWVSWELESADVSLELLLGLREQGVEIEAFSLDRPTIEDAFIQLTGAELEPDLNGTSTTKGARR